MQWVDEISTDTIIALKAGREQAFKKVYQQYSGRLYWNLKRLVKSEETAKELLQEIFLKIWDRRGQIDPDKPFKAYLFKIAENAAYDFFRKAARDAKLRKQLIAQAKASYNHVEEALLKNEYSEILYAAIAALPPRRRQVFQLCKLDGKSYEETAMQLGLSTSTINDHIVKASRFIRQYCLMHHKLIFTSLLMLSMLSIFS